MRISSYLNRSAWERRLRALKAEVTAARTDRGKAIVLAAFALLGLGSCGTGAAVAAWTRACASGCPTAAQIEDFAAQQASVVYDSHGSVVGLYYRERRQPVEITALPRYVPLAFVAIEDQRFFDHGGIDPVRLVAAVRDNLVGGWGGPGGSTITMQLARNLFPQQLPMSEKTLRRKLAEIRLARQIEQRFSKPEILELYLNHIYLGAGAYGIEAASRTYFAKPASQLTVAEAATLAALPKAPSFYDPRRNPEGARERRDLVLRAMAETEVISPESAAELRSSPLVLAPPSGANRAPYFVEHIRRELEDRFGELLYTGGLKIYTSLDSAMQAEAERAISEHLAEVEKGTYGGFRHPTYEQFRVQHADRKTTDYAETPYLQAVATVLDPQTGDVLAMVGGRDFRDSQFNRATQALRQPGSAFKPFVYAAALEQGRSPLYEVSDAPISIAQSDGSVWAPRNFDGEYQGSMSLRAALRQSRNMVTIRLGQEVGIGPVRSVAKRAGLDTPIPGYPSVYIGAAAVYPLDLIASYATFANGGMQITPRFVRRIEDRDGNVLWEPATPPRPALPAGLSWIVTDMLREVVDRGTGYGVRNPAIGNIPYDIPIAGKTGTTNGNTDVWFVGYTPDVLAGVWLGFDQPKTITGSATGGGLAVPIWARVVRKFYESHPIPAPWARPEDAVVRHISAWTGKAVTEDCPYFEGSYADYFVATAAPEPGCDPPDAFRDPNPQLLGRPAIPGWPRVPRLEERIDSIRIPGVTRGQ